MEAKITLPIMGGLHDWHVEEVMSSGYHITMAFLVFGQKLYGINDFNHRVFVQITECHSQHDDEAPLPPTNKGMLLSVMWLRFQVHD